MVMLDGPDAGRRDLDPSVLRARARRGALRRVRPGVFAMPIDRTPEAEHRLRIRATAPLLGDGSALSHLSAAVLHGLPLLRSRHGAVTIVRPASNGRRSTLLHARRAALGPGEVVEIDGIRVTSLERTVRDLAETLPFGEAIMAGDAAVRMGMDPGRVRADGRSRRRIGRVRDALDGRAESAGESLSRAIMLEAGLPEPELQFEVRTAELLARTDFAWPGRRVLAEFDGAVKYRGELDGRSAEEAIMAEKRREWALRELGYEVVRWDWAALREPERLVRRLSTALGL